MRGAHDHQICAHLRCNLRNQLSSNALDDIKVGWDLLSSKLSLQGLASLSDRGILAERALRVRSAIDQIGRECRDEPSVDTMQYRQL